MSEVDFYIKRPELLKRLSVSRNTLNQLIREEGFPRPLVFASQDQRFSSKAVNEWIEQRITSEAPSPAQEA